MKIYSIEEAYRQPDGTSLIEVNRNKQTGAIKEIDVIISQQNGMTVLFGIWSNWNKEEWETIGYKPR